MERGKLITTDGVMDKLGNPHSLSRAEGRRSRSLTKSGGGDLTDDFRRKKGKWLCHTCSR